MRLQHSFLATLAVFCLLFLSSEPCWAEFGGIKAPKFKRPSDVARDFKGAIEGHQKQAENSLGQLQRFFEEGTPPTVPDDFQQIFNRFSDSDFLVPVRQLLEAGLTESTNIHQIRPDEGNTGPAVLYVNGMWTSLSAAKIEAKQLANELGRMVLLVYNDGADPLDDQAQALRDFEQAHYDRYWPYDVGFTSVETLHSPVDALRFAVDALRGNRRALDQLRNLPKLQANSATRQLTRALLDRKNAGCISVVGYSQGCMIVRNALYSLQLLSENEIIKSVDFVAAGSPLHPKEVFPYPQRYTPLVHGDDPVPKIFGLQGGGSGVLKYNKAHHEWAKYYHSIADPSLLCPGNGTLPPQSDPLPPPSTVTTPTLEIHEIACLDKQNPTDRVILVLSSGGTVVSRSGVVLMDDRDRNVWAVNTAFRFSGEVTIQLIEEDPQLNDVIFSFRVSDAQNVNTQTEIQKHNGFTPKSSTYGVKYSVTR